MLKDLNAKTVSSNDLSGKIIVVNIWALWCAPCVREMPELQELYKKYQNDKDVAILTIDDNDDLAKLKQFVNSKKLDFPVLRAEKYLEDNNINAFPNFVPALFRQSRIGQCRTTDTESCQEQAEFNSCSIGRMCAHEFLPQAWIADGCH